MSTKIAHILASKTTTLVALVLYALLMAVATLVEKIYGTPVAKALVYYSPLFLFLQLLMVVNFLLITWQDHLFSRKKWAYLTIHFALVVILTGALITHLFGEEAMMHLREGQKSGYILVKNGKEQTIRELPFELELTDFRLTRYPGSMSPSSYESFLNIHTDGKVEPAHIYMNNVLDLKGYRFYQASFDPDEQGSILSINHDVWGRTVTYAGYLLLFAGLVMVLCSKHSRFRRLWQQLKYGLLPMMFLTTASANAANALDLVIPESQAERFGALPMQSGNGRIVPVNTFASEIVRKLKVEEVIGDWSPEQFLLSVMTYPADWSVVPLVEIKDQEIARTYGWTQGRISYREAFDENQYYRLHEEMETLYRKNPAERTRRDKELLKIDDRINLLHELLTHHLLRIFPDATDTVHFRWVAPGEIATGQVSISARENQEIIDLAQHYFDEIRQARKSQRWEKVDSAWQDISAYQLIQVRGDLIHPQKLQAETIYNRLNLPRLCQIGYLLSGLLLLVLFFLSPGQKQTSTGKKALRYTTVGAILVFFLLHTLSLGMRWYISGYAPWSNSYETMVALSWAGVLCGFIFARRNLLVTALATLFGGAVLFVSSLNWMDPQITPLVPVLKSPWLMAHVASLVLAYGFLGISAMIGTTYLYLSLSRKTAETLVRPLSIINELSMTLGVGLLAVGIFLGAIWANESWGRYWSWDPKETWALITLVVYATVLHLRWFGKGSDLLFHWLGQLSFLSILMTFLGVNYFLSGMHSYGSHDALSAIPWWAYLLFMVFFVLPGILAYGFKKRKKSE